ncbi:MAG: lysophospholipid acyltransferase family protein [bacterium]|nr:lysophospholipid acyltransferase family protein [bacterium]
MINLSELYSDVPPTKLRNIDEKFCPADTSKFWKIVGDFIFSGMLKNRFYAFRYKGAEKFLQKEPNVPVIMYAPHSNWWDGIVGYMLCSFVCHNELRLMVEELKRFPILRHAGCFSVNKKSPQASMEAIKYAINELAKPKCNLYIFPQGIIKPPNFRPIEFQTGLAYMAEKAAKKYGKVFLQPIAVNYFFLRDNRPEVFVELGERIEVTSETKIDRKAFTEYLANNLQELCDNQFQDISHAKFDGYDTLFQQRLKWYRRIEQRLKDWGIKRKKNKA